MSILNPAFLAALTVFFPKTAILVSFCLKSGKFENNDSIPDGLKKTKISYYTFFRSDKSLITVL